MTNRPMYIKLLTILYTHETIALTCKFMCKEGIRLHIKRYCQEHNIESTKRIELNL
jgi:hypothetical protein